MDRERSVELCGVLCVKCHCFVLWHCSQFGQKETVPDECWDKNSSEGTAAVFLSSVFDTVVSLFFFFLFFWVSLCLWEASRDKAPSYYSDIYGDLLGYSLQRLKKVLSRGAPWWDLSSECAAKKKGSEPQFDKMKCWKEMHFLWACPWT